MNRQRLKQLRNKMIHDLWKIKKSEWEMIDVAYIFGLEIAQVYRIIKKEERSKEIN